VSAGSGEPRVVLDVQATQSVMYGGRGIARYVADHATAIEAAAPGLVRAFLLNSRYTIPAAVERLMATERVRWSDRLDPDLMRGPLVYHVMSPFEMAVPTAEVWPLAIRRPGVALVATLYDLIPFIFPDVYLSEPGARARYVARSSILHAADVVLAISESTRRDAIRLLGLDPDRVIAVGAGIDEAFRPPTRPVPRILEELRDSFPDLRDEYLLYTGGVDFRKNMDGLVRAYAGLPESVRRTHQLVIVCRARPEDEAHLKRVAADNGVADDLLLTNFVPDEVLVSLYQAAHLFVFPSYYEGFGLPVAEAMACGAPVVASAVSSMPELVPAEALFNPHDPEAFTGMLLRGATDAGFRNALRRSADGARERFRWSRVAEATVEAYRRSGDGLRTVRRTRPRIALVTPYPPELSGVAVYSANLAAFLSRYCDVDCFVRNEPRTYHTPYHPRTRLYQATQLEGRNDLVRYDRIVYCMGNSDLHEFVLQALERLPGDVLTHDVRLVRFYEWRSGNGGPTLADTLQGMYGARLPAELEGAQVLATPDARRLGVWMLGDVIRHADRVLVHSRFARDVVRLEAEAAGESLEVLTLPFGFPAAPPGPARLRFPSYEPAIVSFGLVDAVKGVDALVAAMPAVLRRHPRATLTLVGPVNDIERARIGELARRAGVEERVTLTGTVDQPTYTRWLRRADVAVQLREVAQGEASLTVAETMAHGVPTVVTRIGWMAELPDDAVAKVGLGADAEELGRAVLGLLDDPGRWWALGEAGARHARDNNFGWAAEALYRVLVPPEDRPAVHPRLPVSALA